MGQEQQNIKVGQYEVPVRIMGEGKPTLLLHGFDGPLDGPFLGPLAAGRRIIAPTHPGFAGTTLEPDLHGLHNVVLFYLELLDRLEISEVDIVGHSLGGMFAAEIAAMVPERVRRLVLAAPIGLWFEEAEVPDVLATGGSALGRLLFVNPGSEAVAAYQPSQFERTCNWAAATNYMWPIPDRGLAERIYRVTSPTLLLRGAADGVISGPYLSAYAKHLAHSQSAEIADAGHLPMVEQPDEFGRVVNNFLDS